MSRSLCAWMVLFGSGLALAQSQPYRRSGVPNKDLCLTWNTRNFVYNVDVAGNAKTPGDTEFVAIDAAFGTWQALSDGCSDFRFIRGPRITKIFIGKYPGSSDNNTITFRQKSCRDVVPEDDKCLDPDVDDCGNKYNCWDHSSDLTIALTTTTFSFKTGQIFDADIEFNAAEQADGESFLFTTLSSPPCDPSNVATSCVSMDVQNTITHEVGHAMGLDHVDVPGSTMEATAPVGETRKRVIDSGTAQGFCETYPRGQPPMPCDELGQLRKKVIAKGSGTAGMESVGCTSVGAGGAGLAWLLILGPLWKRRRR